MVNGHKAVPREVIHVNHWGHAKLIAYRLRKPLDPNYDVCLSRMVHGRLMGGCLYQQYNGRTICMHVASFTPRWLSRNALYMAFHYPFVQLKVDRILGLVSEDNARSLKFNLGLGFTEHSRIPDVVPGGALVILSMRREQCRWLDWHPRGLCVQHTVEPPYGQQPADPPAARFQ